MPRYRGAIEWAPSLEALWDDLLPQFASAYRCDPWDEATIAGIYDFALWCWHGSVYQHPHGPLYRGNSRSAIKTVFVQFFEWLPQDPVRRQDMARWLCENEFMVLQAGPFGRSLSPNECTQMVWEFRQAKAECSAPEPLRCTGLHFKIPRRYR